MTFADAPAVHRRELDAILAGDGLRAVYQPIVCLETGSVVGWEGLVRGPAGSPLELPDQLFATAAAGGRTADLDWAAATVVLGGALDAGLGAGDGTLFLNLEPVVHFASVPQHTVELRQEAQRRGMSVVVEMTERVLAHHPAWLLERIARYRGFGWGIAIDDVGADRRSLALMPFMRPDVVKLDMRFVQQPLTAELARTANAVVAEVERSGARLVAEGIEHEDHAQVARALGADLGQGWLFGRPGDLDLAPSRGTPVLPRRFTPSVAAYDTPFSVLSAHRPVLTSTKEILLRMSLQLEAEALTSDSAVVLATFQDGRHFTARTRRRYCEIARTVSFVAALAANLGPEPAPRIRGVALDEGEPLRGEWDVLVITPYFAGAFAAQDLGDGGPDMERRFRFAMTYDRELVAMAAETLMRRIAPAVEHDAAAAVQATTRSALGSPPSTS